MFVALFNFYEEHLLKKIIIALSKMLMFGKQTNTNVNRVRVF